MEMESPMDNSERTNQSRYAMLGVVLGLYALGIWLERPLNYVTCLALLVMAAYELYERSYPKLWAVVVSITILNLLLMREAHGAYPECQWPQVPYGECNVWLPCTNGCPPGGTCYYHARCGNISAAGGPLCVYSSCGEIKPVEHQRVANDDKSSLKATQEGFAAYGALATITAVTWLDPAGKAFFGITAAVASSIATLLGQIDPFDPEWQTVFEPVVKKVPSSITREVWRDLIRNQNRIEAYAHALKVEIDRANSARHLGNTVIEDIHQDVIDSYVTQLGVLFGREVRLRKAAGATFPTLANNPLLNSLWLAQLRAASEALR